MSQTTPQPVSSSPPGQQDQSARLAASAQVDQAENTSLSIFLFVALFITAFGLAALFFVLLVNFPDFTIGLILGLAVVRCAWFIWKHI